jgi:DNA-binding LytR/AlgR family response regulator
MSRILIVGDDADFRQHMISMLLPQYELMFPEGVDSRAALVRIQRMKPGVVILRAELRNRHGLDLAAQILRLYETAIIVVATSESLATKAFELGVADYVLAPVRSERLAIAMRRALGTSAGCGPTGQKRLPSHGAPLTSKLRVKSRSGFIFLNYEELMWVGAEGNYVKLHCADVEYDVRERLSDFIVRVDHHGFMRIHRSIIVNTAWIRELRSGGSGNYILVLQNSMQLPVSRPYHDAVEEWMKSGGFPPGQEAGDDAPLMN